MAVYVLNRFWLNDIQGSLDEFKEVAAHLDSYTPKVNITAIDAGSSRFTFTTDINIRSTELVHLKITRVS